MKRFAAVVLFALAAGCGTDKGKPDKKAGGWDDPDSMGVLTFVVRETGDRPATGFSFVLYSMNPEGPWSYAEPRTAQAWYSQRLPAGVYGLEVFSEAGAYRNTKIRVESGKENRFNAHLEPGGGIQGIVCGQASKMALPGCRVFRPLDRGFTPDTAPWDPKNSTPGSAIVKTDDSGYFKLLNLPPGDNLIVFYVDQLGWTEETVEVKDGIIVDAGTIYVGKR